MAYTYYTAPDFHTLKDNQLNFLTYDETIPVRLFYMDGVKVRFYIDQTNNSVSFNSEKEFADKKFLDKYKELFEVMMDRFFYHSGDVFIYGIINNEKLYIYDVYTNDNFLSHKDLVKIKDDYDYGSVGFIPLEPLIQGLVKTNRLLEIMSVSPDPRKLVLMPAVYIDDKRATSSTAAKTKSEEDYYLIGKKQTKTTAYGYYDSYGVWHSNYSNGYDDDYYDDYYGDYYGAEYSQWDAKLKCYKHWDYTKKDWVVDSPNDYDFVQTTWDKTKFRRTKKTSKKNSKKKDLASKTVVTTADIKAAQEKEEKKRKEEEKKAAFRKISSEYGQEKISTILTKVERTALYSEVIKNVKLYTDRTKLVLTDEEKRAEPYICAIYSAYTHPNTRKILYNKVNEHYNKYKAMDLSYDTVVVETLLNIFEAWNKPRSNLIITIPMLRKILKEEIDVFYSFYCREEKRA